MCAGQMGQPFEWPVIVEGGWKLWPLPTCTYCHAKNAPASATQCFKFDSNMKAGCYRCVVQHHNKRFTGSVVIDPSRSNHEMIRELTAGWTLAPGWTEWCYEWFQKGHCHRGKDCFRQHGQWDPRAVYPKGRPAHTHT